MKNMSLNILKTSLEEKIVYLIIFAIIFFGRIFNTSDSDLYSYLYNTNIITILYIPMFLFIIIKSYLEREKSIIVLRYESIIKWAYENFKIIVCKSIKITIVFNILTFLCMILTNINLIHKLEFYKFIYFSIIIQSVGWVLIGMMLLIINLIIKNIKISFLIQIVILIAIKIIESPISVINVENLIIPIWQTMFFYDLTFIDYKKKAIYLVINILAISIMFLVYFYFYKKKDFKYER